VLNEVVPNDLMNCISASTGPPQELLASGPIARTASRMLHAATNKLSPLAETPQFTACGSYQPVRCMSVPCCRAWHRTNVGQYRRPLLQLRIDKTVYSDAAMQMKHRCRAANRFALGQASCQPCSRRLRCKEWQQHWPPQIAVCGLALFCRLRGA